ncbi:hypothetical protein HFP15_03720 [Amycolatopsis sp. K13G38]|uniref:DUF2970 domain-containing protein n=1 Tax=Amycolatopsis acididurans TaxID=2724524 RepID=A0ABX1IWX6_9PSEU|nr:hypothetical protein [Amycolatopsis acididurans]NKQ51987.1 hypothetical protein [Amycolatopsis acididurans]
MSNTIHHTIRIVAGARHHYVRLGLALTGLLFACANGLDTRWARMRACGDRGSESVEKAVLVAIGLAVAVGLGFAIRTLVVQLQGQYKPPTQP